MDILNKYKELEYKKLEYKKARAKYLKQIIPRIGTIEESEDCIICYVNQELLEKNSKKAFYELHCDGMNTIYDKSRELVDYFKLNKPLYYIFDGIHFDTVVNIASTFSNIIFRNCTFNTGIRIFFADTITLEDNKYNCWTSFKDYGNAFLWGKAKNLEVKNENFINQSELKKYGENNFGINIEVDNLKIDNSTICAESHGQINVKAKKTNILNSNISAPEIYLDSDSIVFDRSLLTSDNGIIIENKNCECDTEVGFYNVDSPYTIYNGTEIITNYEAFKDEEIKEKRLALVNVLTNVINKCNQNTLVKSASVKKTI